LGEVVRLRFKLWLTIFVFLILFVLLSVGPFSAERQARLVAREFLEYLCRGAWVDAFTHVAYFDVASDLEPTVPYDQAKRVWVERVKKLQEEGVYVKSYSGLRTWTDDGYPQGEVTLTIIGKGREVFRRYRLHFARHGGVWKVQNLYEAEGLSQHVLEKALGGYIPPGAIDKRED
jgi:hypothetical protein